MQSDILKEINALAKKKKEEGLTEEETKRQKELYDEYLKNFRERFTKQLDNIDVEYDDGKVIKLTDLKKDK